MAQQPEQVALLPRSAAQPSTASADATLNAELSASSSSLTFVPGRVVPAPVEPPSHSEGLFATELSPWRPVALIRVGPSSDPASPSAEASRMRAEKRRRNLWLALGVAQLGAATFDAYTTRAAIGSGAAFEANPSLRPFAGNDSLYVAIQAGPLVVDYVAKRMMTSHYRWMRRTWWIPQAVGTAISVGSGVHNLGVGGVPPS